MTLEEAKEKIRTYLMQANDQIQKEDAEGQKYYEGQADAYFNALRALDQIEGRRKENG